MESEVLVDKHDYTYAFVVWQFQIGAMISVAYEASVLFLFPYQSC